ncbi:hypothetical protein MBLNU457_4849t1 [Dothideomycetes sp. NU457]
MCDKRQSPPPDSPPIDDLDSLDDFLLSLAENDRPAIERLLQLPPVDKPVAPPSSTPTTRKNIVSSQTSPRTTSNPATPSTPSLVSSPTISSPSLQTPTSSMKEQTYSLPDEDTGPYHCIFSFLGCNQTSSSPVRWREHTTSHLHGSPPRKLQCPYCTKSSPPMTWQTLLDHILSHYSNGWQGFEGRQPASVPDASLIDCLWRNKVVTPDQKKELDVRKCLDSGGEAYLLTQGNRQDGKRVRRDTRPGRVGVQNGYNT